MSAQPARYAAFVSYAHRDLDRTWAAWISGTLETWRTPKSLVERGHTRRLGRVFRDEEELAAAPDLPAAIQAALRAADHLIVVCSPAAAESRWVNDEIDYFRSLGREDRVVALLVDGDAAQSRPPALEAIPDLGFVDVREAKGASLRYRRQSARLALVGAVLGCPDEELQEREAERRLRRVAVATTFSVLLAVAATALVLFSFEQQAAAEEARRTEADRLHRASELTSFMTYDLYERLLPIGRLDLLEEVARELAAYYDTLPSRHGTVAERVKNADVHKRLSWVLLTTGDTDGALERDAARREILDELLSSDPANPDLAAEVAYAGHDAANTRFRRGDHALALELNLEALRLSEKHARAHPAYLPLRVAIAYQLTGIARSLSELEQLAAASDRAGQAVLAWTDLASDATDGRWQSQLGTAHLTLGDISKARGDLPASIASFRVGLEMFKRLSDRDQRNFATLERVARTQNHLSAALLASGEVLPALESSRAALAIRERMVAQDPLNTSWRTDLTAALYTHGELLELLGRDDEVLAAATRSRDITLELSALDPANTTWLERVAQIHGHLGQLWLNRDRDEDAEAELELALKATVRLEAAGASSSQDRAIWRVDLMRKLANLEHRRGDVRAAIRIYNEALMDVLAARDAAPDLAVAILAEVVTREELAHFHGIAGDLGAARAHFEQARLLVEELVNRDPTNVHWRQAYAKELLHEGRYLADAAPREALPVLRLAEAQAQTLVDRSPLDARHLGHLLEVREDIGTLLINLGHSVDGEALFREMAAALRELVVEQFSPDRNLIDLSQSISSIATVITERGESLLGAETFLVARRCLERLLRSQPDRVDWSIRLTKMESEAAAALIAADRLDRAGELLVSAQVRLEDVLELDPTSVDVYDALGIVLHRRGEILKQDRIDEAIATYREAVRVLQIGLELDPSHRNILTTLHTTWARIGAALVTKGDIDGAMEAAAESTRLEMEALERAMADGAKKPEGPENGK